MPEVEKSALGTTPRELSVTVPIAGRPRNSWASTRLEPLYFMPKQTKKIEQTFQTWWNNATPETRWMHTYVKGMARAMGWPERG